MHTDASPETTREEPATSEAPWGRLRVSRRCCGAAACRNYAPELFAEVGGDLPLLPDGHEPGAFTGVVRHPASAEDYVAARTAVAACAFGAVTLSKPTRRLPSELRASPWKRYPSEVAPGVWLLGQPSPRNYGAMAWFIARPEGGILVDLPKPNKRLLAWLEERGVTHIFLTHADHAQHHAEFAARFPCARRVLGAADVNRWAHAYADATTDVEVMLPSDRGPVDLEGNPIPLEELAFAELALLPQPGHTPGGFCLLYRGRYLFTGDHLSYNGALGHLYAHRLQCWQDWERQTASIDQMRRWASDGHLTFCRVLPGHGEWAQISEEPSATATAEALARCVAWMRQQPSGRVSLMRWVPFVIARTQPESRLGRLLRALGGAAGEAWLLPGPVRHLLPGHGL